MFKFVLVELVDSLGGAVLNLLSSIVKPCMSFSSPLISLFCFFKSSLRVLKKKKIQFDSETLRYFIHNAFLGDVNSVHFSGVVARGCDVTSYLAHHICNMAPRPGFATQINRAGRCCLTAGNTGTLLALVLGGG